MRYMCMNTLIVSRQSIGVQIHTHTRIHTRNLEDANSVITNLAPQRNRKGIRHKVRGVYIILILGRKFSAHAQDFLRMF